MSDQSYPPIEDYAAIGDCRCLGLISSHGSLDWLCLPRFDSPALFGALLDSERGGKFVIRPVATCRVKRSYIENTAVLQTTFTTDSGELCLTDFMPVGFRNDYRRMLWPERSLLRMAECLKGEVEIEVFYEPRPQFGEHTITLMNRHKLGLHYEHQGHALNLLTGFPLRLMSDGSAAVGRATLQSGESAAFSLSYTDRNVATLSPLENNYLHDQQQMTINWWHQWVGRCTYRGRYQKEVLRSLITLKLLSYAPSGAVIAAPTSSLPEIIGGTRNWDYRFCWLRDAAMTIRAFLYLGYTQEAESFLSWLLNSTRLSRPELQVLYSVYGETHFREHELSFLNGYRSSRPVRVGNGATNQLQLDIYGEVVQGAFEIAQKMESFDHTTSKMLLDLGNVVCRKWREPDMGIWEIRTDSRHNTHSKVMCWVALDRLLELHNMGFVKIPVEKFKKERDSIRKSIEENGYNKELQSYTSYFGSTDVDISLFLLPIYQYIDAADEKMVGTYKRISESLEKNDLFYRFPYGYDGINEGEGTFAIAVFLAVKVLSERGEKEKAHALFESALRYANDVGLYGEEIDAASGAALGNFPQAYTHVGLINAAAALAGEEG